MLSDIVFINGFNATNAGGRTILINYLRVHASRKEKLKHVVFIRDRESIHEINHGDDLIFLEAPRLLRYGFLTPLINYFIVPAYLEKFNVKYFLNFSDIPVCTKRKQIFAFDWPYAAFLKSQAWGLLSWSEYFSRKLKLILFRAWICYIDRIIVQTPILEKIMRDEYGFSDILVVPNAVSPPLELAPERSFNFGNAFTLLCLTHYYPHKNIEIFIPLAVAIKKAKLDIKIVTTISRDQGLKANRFLNLIEKLGLSDIITNIGEVELDDVPQLYRKVDCLLLPSLLETFSGTYVEAMHFGVPILTSNLPFAIGVCADAAIYFDQDCHLDILSKIQLVMESEKLMSKMRNLGVKQLSKFPTWEQTYDMYQSALGINEESY